MQGRRVDKDMWRNDPQPGDYYWSEHMGRWWVRDPLGRPGTLNPELHAVTEHEDGTITVEPSIWDYPDGWHGWLRQGVWTSV